MRIAKDGLTLGTMEHLKNKGYIIVLNADDDFVDIFLERSQSALQDQTYTYPLVN